MSQRTALLSVYDKTGIVEFASALVRHGFNLIASGGTKTALEIAGLEARDVAELVGGGAILDHRVVTLSREVHAGLLSTNSKDDLVELELLGIPRIDLVCVNLYPLVEEIAKPDATIDSVREKTDIGGPTMLRAAAKGQRIVVCNPSQYDTIIDWIDDGYQNEEIVLKGLAAIAEDLVANYVKASAEYLVAEIGQENWSVLTKLGLYRH